MAKMKMPKMPKMGKHSGMGIGSITIRPARIPKIKGLKLPIFGKGNRGMSGHGGM